MATLNQAQPPDKDVEIAFLRSELSRVKAELEEAKSELAGHTVTKWKERAFKAEAIVRIIPRGERESNIFTVYPRCAACGEKSKYHVGFRGNLAGKLFAGNDEDEVRKKVEEQGQILGEKGEIPDFPPEDKKD